MAVGRERRVSRQHRHHQVDLVGVAQLAWAWAWAWAKNAGPTQMVETPLFRLSGRCLH